MNDHLRGIAITTLGVLLVTPDSLFVRLIGVDPLVTAFWRGFLSGSAVLVYVLLFQGIGAFGAVLRTGWIGLIYIVLVGSTTLAFVMAVEHTSVANAVFIFAAMPVFAMIFSWLLLGERVSARMVWTMIAVGGGLAVIAYGSGENEIAHWVGDLFALYVAGAYALALTLVRRVRDISMIPAIPIAYIGAAAVLAIFVNPLPAFTQQAPLFIGHGLFIGAATCLLTIGPRYISAAEVALLVLLESVLAPILVWFVINEYPGTWALIGGMIVIGALLVSNFVALRRRRAEKIARDTVKN